MQWCLFFTESLFLCIETLFSCTERVIWKGILIFWPAKYKLDAGRDIPYESLLLREEIILQTHSFKQYLFSIFLQLKHLHTCCCINNIVLGTWWEISVLRPSWTSEKDWVLVLVWETVGNVYMKYYVVVSGRLGKTWKYELFSVLIDNDWTEFWEFQASG